MVRAGESRKRPQKDEKKAVCRCFEKHNVFIGCQHQQCTQIALLSAVQRVSLSDI